MNAIVPATSTTMSYDQIERLGEQVARSGLFGIKTPAQAVTLMMIAQAEGRHPALAARDYDIIGNRPAKKSEAMLRDFLEAGGKVQWHTLTDDLADASFSHPAGGTARITWDMQRAAKAGLKQKENYTKYPRQMLRSRVVSEGCRTIWPAATSGMYVPEEVREMEPAHNGPTIDAQLEPAATRREQMNRDVPLTASPEVKKVTLREWLDDFESRTIAAQTQEEADAILKEERVMRLDDPDLVINEAARQRALTARRRMIDRLWQQEPDDEEELPEVEIAGAEKVSAG